MTAYNPLWKISSGGMERAVSMVGFFWDLELKSHSNMTTYPPLLIKVDLEARFAHRTIYCPGFRTGHFESSFICPRFQADLCTPCINMPQISGRFMHPVHWYVPDFRLFFAPRKRQLWFSRLMSPFPEHNVANIAHTIGRQKWIVQKSRQVMPFQEYHVPNFSRRSFAPEGRYLWKLGPS